MIGKLLISTRISWAGSCSAAPLANTRSDTHSARSQTKQMWWPPLQPRYEFVTSLVYRACNKQAALPMPQVTPNCTQRSPVASRQLPTMTRVRHGGGLFPVAQLLILKLFPNSNFQSNQTERKQKISPWKSSFLKFVGSNISVTRKIR